MISLKAISTGRRRTDLLILALLLVLSPLGAKDWRAGILTVGASDEAVSAFTSALEMGGSVLSDPEKTERAEERLSRKARYVLDKEKAGAARSEKPWKEKERKADDSPWKVLPVEVEVDDEELGFLLEGNESAFDFVRRMNDLDELWLIEGTMRDGLEETVISRDGKEEMVLLSGHEFRKRDERMLLCHFLSEYRDEKVWPVEVRGNVEADITVGGEPVEMIGGWMLLKEPVSEITLSKPLYSSETVTVDAEKEPVLEYELSSLVGESVFVSSIPYTDRITHNGKKAEGGYVPSPTLPFTVSLSEDSSESLVISSPVSTGLLEPVLFPSELVDPDRLLDARDRFYGDLLLTLGGFGLGVVSTVLDRTVDADLTGLETFSWGLSVFQLIRTVDSLFAYKDAMRFGL